MQSQTSGHYSSLPFIIALASLVGLFIAGCGQSFSPSSIELEADSVEETAFSHSNLLHSFDDGRTVRLNRPSVNSTDHNRQFSRSPYFRTSRQPQFGHGASIDSLLGYADYIRSMDSSITSVVRISLGNFNSPTKQLSDGLPTSSVWTLNIDSDHELILLRALPNTESREFHQSDNGKSISMAYALPYTKKDELIEFDGIIFGVRIKGINSTTANHCTPLPEIVVPPFISKFDPFAIAIAVEINRINWKTNRKNGYYYSPAQCAMPYEDIKLNITGQMLLTTFNLPSKTSDPVATEQFLHIREDLSPLLNAQPGYANFRKVTFPNTTNSMSLRAINFDGNDWRMR